MTLNKTDDRKRRMVNHVTMQNNVMVQKNNRLHDLLILLSWTRPSLVSQRSTSTLTTTKKDIKM